VGEEAVLLDSSFPSGVLCDQVPQQCDHLGGWQSDLLGRVQLTQSDRIVLKRTLVDSHREGDTALVCASIALTNSVRAVVNLA